jgi:hypothetical protein
LAQLFSTPSRFWRRRPLRPRYSLPASGNLGLSPRRAIPRAACRHLHGMCAWNDVSHFLYLLTSWGALSRKHTWEALNFHRSVARPEPLMPSSSSETAWVEALMAACKEGTVPKAQAQEKMVEPPILMEATSDNASPRAGAGRANEVRPQSVGAPGRAGLTPGSSREADPNHPGRSPWVTFHLFLGLPMSWTWETRSWGCWDSPKHLFCPSTWGKWREAQSWLAHRLRPSTNCCGKH